MEENKELVEELKRLLEKKEVKVDEVSKRMVKEFYGWVKEEVRDGMEEG